MSTEGTVGQAPWTATASESRGEANAQRIAAAQEMLSALEMMLSDCTFPTATHLNIVRHAIAKAKGA